MQLATPFRGAALRRSIRPVGDAPPTRCATVAFLWFLFLAVFLLLLLLLLLLLILLLSSAPERRWAAPISALRLYREILPLAGGSCDDVIVTSRLGFRVP